MRTWRNNPDSPENLEATKQIEREKFALKMQEKQDRRSMLLSALRARWSIKQQEAAQLVSAIEVLSDENYADGPALEIADQILKANIGP